MTFPLRRILPPSIRYVNSSDSVVIYFQDPRLGLGCGQRQQVIFPFP